MAVAGMGLEVSVGDWSCCWTAELREVGADSGRLACCEEEEEEAAAAGSEGPASTAPGGGGVGVVVPRLRWRWEGEELW